jgi:hypothetical protein
MIINCISLLSLDERHFLPEIELQQKGAARGVSNPLSNGRSPFEWSVCCYGLAELSADNCKIVRNVVAELVELGSFELML